MSSLDALESILQRTDRQVLHLDALCTPDQPGFTALANAWTGQRGTSLTPDADTFDLIEIGQCLENAVRLSVDDQKTATFRFVGPAVCARLQGDPTGLNLFDFIDHLPLDGPAILQSALETPAGLHVVYEMAYKSGRRTKNRGLYLPLLSKNNRCAQVFGMQAVGDITTYEADGSTHVAATELVSANWVDLGAGAPGDSLPC
jgi:PAS domain